jgi:hypothetical protein
MNDQRGGDRVNGSDGFGECPVRRSEGLLSEAVGGELLVFDAQSSVAHCLNETAAIVWEACDGRNDLDGLAAVAGCGREVVAEVLAALDEKGLLLHAAGADGRVVRREALKRFAKAGVVAGSVPLIVSAFVETPLAHASGGVLAACSPCTPGADTCTAGYVCDASLSICIPNNCVAQPTCTGGTVCTAGTWSGTCTAMCSTNLCCV